MSDHPMMGRSHSKKHYHEQSMDDFIKHLRKFNLRSERYIASKPLGMYMRHNTTKTVEKSRSQTLSNRKSLSKSKKVKKKVETLLSNASRQKEEKKKKSGMKIFIERSKEKNVAELIQGYSEKLSKVKKYLESKNQIGLLLCHKFTEMLNEIIETTICQLDREIKQTEKEVTEKLDKRFEKERNYLRKQNLKLEKKTLQLVQKLDSNTKLIYYIRQSTDLDIDYMFGVSVLGTDQCGGQGYEKKSLNQSRQHQEKNVIESGRIRPARPEQSQAYQQHPRIYYFDNEHQRHSFG